MNKTTHKKTTLHHVSLQFGVRHYHNMQAREARQVQLENANAKDSERRRQQEMLEMMKMQQQLFYTIIATIGIPVVLLVVFYIDVSILVPYIQVHEYDVEICNSHMLHSGQASVHFSSLFRKYTTMMQSVGTIFLVCSDQRGLNDKYRFKNHPELNQ